MDRRGEMANMQPSLNMPPSFAGASPPSPSQLAVGSGGPVMGQASKDKTMASAEQLVLDLCDPELRENALLELSKKREIFQDLAPLLWHSFGTIAALLQEIVSIYPALSPPTLSPGASNRVCNALALLQCVASHHETRILFLNAHIPLYLYPFLNTTSKTRPFEYLRLTSLGVIGALVKVDDTEVISFLLQTEIIPLCLRTMEMGSELSKTPPPHGLRHNTNHGIVVKCETVATYLTNAVGVLPLPAPTITSAQVALHKWFRLKRCRVWGRVRPLWVLISHLVATFIVQKILLDDVGLRYICATAERFFAVGSVLANMVVSLADQPSTRLLKHIIRCYLRLSDNPRACAALQSCLPDMLKDGTFTNCLRDDATTRRWLQQLLHNVTGAGMGGAPQPGLDHMMGNMKQSSCCSSQQ